MVPISGFIVFCLIITLGYFAGLLTFITDHEENRCEMTYMFEYPQFVRVSQQADSQYKKYGLYVYSEGHFTQRARQMHFDGIPVLFIPGNAGSHKQVRSLASVALRKSLDSRPGFHFDFFTVDLNNELSGLNGALLYEQMEYVNHSIARVFELYDDDRRHQPKSMVLIGHSMGGIIATGLLASLPQNSGVLPLIITLATPHVRAPLAFDSYLHDFYKNMQKSTSLPENSTVIALSGGYNDFVISPFITYARDFENLHFATTSVPLVWLPVDHLCILWCKQLVLAIIRGLFDVVDLSTKQISLDPEYHRTVFQHHLKDNSGTKVRKAEQYKLPISLGRSQDDWVENLQRQYSISLLQGVRQNQWHMIRLFDEADYEYLTVLALNLEITDWAFACPAEHLRGQNRICLEGLHLSQLSEIAPSIKYKRRALRLNLRELKKNYTQATHVILRVLPTKEPVVLHVDRYGADEREVEVNLPRWWSLNRQSIIAETPEKAVHYELALPQLQHIIQSYKLYIEPVKCTHNSHHASATLIVPWANHDIHDYITETERGPLNIRLYSSRPQGLSNSSFAVVRLNLDPICTYSISIRNSILGMLGQLARIYSPMLIANTVAVVLLSFRNQLVSIDETGSCSLFFNAIKHGIKPYYILTMVKLVSKGLSWRGFSRILPVPDWQLIGDEGNDFFLLPLLLYMCSVGIVWMAALGLASSLIFCESTFHKGATKFLARTVTGAVKFSDWLIGGFHKLPGAVATLLIILSVSTCGGVALCLGCGFYFLKLTQMSQDYVEGLVLRIMKYLAKKFKRRILPTRTNENVTQDNFSSQDRLTITENSALPQTNEQDENLVKKDEKGETSNNLASKDEGKEEEEKEETTAKEQDKKSEDNDEAVPGCSSEGGIAIVNKEEQTSEQNEEVVERREGEPEQNNIESNSREPSEHSSIFFHFSIFLLWSIVAGLSVPSVLTWAHNFKYNSMLQPDPSFLPGIILSVCAVPLWQMELPKNNIVGYVQLGQVLNIMAAACLIYAPLSVYRLGYIITGTIVLITLHQLLAPARPDIAVSSQEDTPEPHEPETLFERVKAKWE